jgi:hypothetical protein
MILPPFLRRPGVTMALILALVGISVWINWPRPAPVDLPRLDPAALAAITNSREDAQRLKVHLSSLLYRSHGALAPWTELPTAVRPLWSTLLLEAGLESGLGFLREPPQPGVPTPADAADGYEAMGSPALAALLRELVPALADPDRPPPAPLCQAFGRRYAELLPKAQVARLVWIRAHADEIARP